MVCKHSECNNNTGICRKSADFYNLALNFFYRWKTFVIFKSATFEVFLKIMGSVGGDANSVFHEVGSVGGDANSVFHEDQKIFKSDTIFVTF